MQILFFIDGLDEFDGKHIDFCESLLSMAGSPSLKLCVSSRPWNIFEESFGKDERRKIYIHELTRRDITEYVHDWLHRHPRWRGMGSETARAHALVSAITEKAQGVFL